MKNEKNIREIANSFVSTDALAVMADVDRLGSVEAAADYAADIAAGQPDWDILDTEEGRAALAEAIRQLVEEI